MRLRGIASVSAVERLVGVRNCAFTDFFRCFCLVFSRLLTMDSFQRRLYRCQLCRRAAFRQLNVIGLMRFQGGGRAQNASLLIAQNGVTAFQRALRIQCFELRLQLLQPAQAGVVLLLLRHLPALL